MITVTDLALPSRVIAGINPLGGIPDSPARPVDGECWVWTRNTYPSGYGRCWINGENRGVHQIVFEAHFGVRSDRERFIDHICRNRRCCNPEHLELVTPLGNQLSAQRDHCVNGHEFTPENTHRPASRPTTRVCRACGREKARRHRARSSS